jgi:hypothetical protein
MAGWRVTNDWNGGVFLLNDQLHRFWAKTKNTGNMTETSVPVYCFVRDSAGGLVFADTVTLTNVPYGRVDSVAFAKTWTTVSNGLHTLRVITNLTGDMVRLNDTMPVEVRVVTYPAELGYDRSSASGFITPHGKPCGYANRFGAPGSPIQVMGIKAYLQASPAAGCTMFLFSDTAGKPGAVLSQGVVPSVGAAGWYQKDFLPPITVNSGRFFAGVVSGADSILSYGYDDWLPISRQAWQYTGAWTSSPALPKRDLMIRALVRTPAAADVGVIRLLAPGGTIDSNATVTPACSVYNYGASTPSYPVRMKIGADYNNTTTVTTHAPGTVVYVTFPTWMALPRGASAVSCSTELIGDAAPGNDRQAGTVLVRVQDVAALSIEAPGDSFLLGDSISPVVSVENRGTDSAIFPVQLAIGSWTMVMTDTLPAGAQDQVYFPNWQADSLGWNAMVCSTELDGDLVAGNNRVRDSVLVWYPTGFEEAFGLPPRFELDCRPNPVTDNTVISYSLPTPSQVSIKLYEVTGKLVSTLARGYHPTGSYCFSIGPWGLGIGHSRLARGIYVLKFETEGYSTTRKLVLE